MNNEPNAYPLSWPAGWKRTSDYQRKSPQFKKSGERLSIAEAINRLLRELKQQPGIVDDSMVVSTNVKPTLAGMPSSRGGAQPDDPGVAVYWTCVKRGSNGQAKRIELRRCIASDAYLTVAGNLGAIAATLEAMRAIERHGGAEILDRAFTGFTALPAPEQWFQVLGVGANATVDEIKAAHRRLASDIHPDAGGNDAQMARVNVARDEGLRSLAR